jgi:hypothetical protein
VVFGLWFLACLVLAVRAIRRDDIVHHRRWMIRAFAIAIGVGTIRIWIGLFQTAALLDSRRASAQLSGFRSACMFWPPSCGCGHFRILPSLPTNR